MGKAFGFMTFLVLASVMALLVSLMLGMYYLLDMMF